MECTRFDDESRRLLANTVLTGSRNAIYWTAVAGVLRTGAAVRGNWSLEGEYLPHRLYGAGLRAEDRASDGAEVAYLPHLNVHFPGTRYTVRLTIERRLQKFRNATLIELGTVF